jgi:hypothetical protein
MSVSNLSVMFFLGLFGTGHCLGMCGPLVVAFPGRTGSIGAHLGYHMGRIMTYAVCGAMLGGLGNGIALVASKTGADYLLWTAQIQILFSLLAAGFLLIFGLSRIGLVREPRWMAIASPSRIPGFNRILVSATRDGSFTGMMSLGMIMGFLPCGLSFGAFSRALPSGGLCQGGAMLLAFGLGTLPGLLLIGLGAAGLARKYRRHSDIVSGVLMIGMSASLAVSGLQAIAA